MHTDDTDAQVVAALADGRPLVELAHARQRTEGVVAVTWRDGKAVRLCAHRCGLARLPERLAALEKLERLDVGGNQLGALPALPAGLRELYVDDNQLVQLPALPTLAVLDANRNRLERVPALADLAFAYLADNRLTVLPEIRNVRYLNVSDNPLRELVLAPVAGDDALRELRAERAQLRTIELAGLRALCELALRGNRLAKLPDSFARLRVLRTLDVRGNELDDVPEGLRDLPLGKLDLRWNPLRARPSWPDELAARGCLVPE
jgi:Leucine-rich repeat (LRR) protein